MSLNHALSTPGHAVFSCLYSVRRRVRATRVIRGASAGFTAALAVWLACALGKYGLGQALPPARGSAIACALFTAACGLLIGARKIDLLDVALLSDVRSGTNERLATALDFLKRGKGGELIEQAQVSDADTYAEKVIGAVAAPLRAPRSLAAALVLLLTLGGLYFLGEHRSLPHESRRDAADVRIQGREIVRLANSAAANAALKNLPETRKAAAEAARLGQAMRSGSTTKRAALLKLHALTRRIQETQKRLSAQSTPKSMDHAKQEFARALSKIQQAQPQAAERPTHGSDPQHTPPGIKKQTPESPAMKALSQLAQAMKQGGTAAMQKALKQLQSRMQSGQMSPGEMKKTSQALRALANSLTGTSMGAAAHQLNGAAAAMDAAAAGNNEALQQAANALQEANEALAKGGADTSAMLDARTLGDLASDLEGGRLTMAMSGLPGYGGKGPGNGYGGHGGESRPMKEPVRTKAKLIARSNLKPIRGSGRAGSQSEMGRYAASSAHASAHLPNGKIAGVRMQAGNEMQIPFSGDPDGSSSSSPYFRVYQASKRQAETSLDKEGVPATYRKQVRDYFDNIRP